MRRPPKDTEESARQITRRGLVLGGGMAVFGGVLAARMRYMQVDQADQFRLLAEENRIKFELVPPNRGLIFDRNGVPLAENEQVYRVVIVPEDAGDVEKMIHKLRSVIDLTDEEAEEAIKDIRKASPFHKFTVADRLTWDDIARVAVNAPALPGVTPEVGLSRVYPLSEDLAHIIGYVGRVSDYDLSKIEDPDPLLLTPKFQIGKLGVENKLELSLRGTAGSKQVEVNAAGRIMRELGRKDGTAGNDIQLTVDHRLQSFVQARLAEGKAASAVVMDVTNGDILASGSYPSFDPNKFVRGISTTDYNTLIQDEVYRPLTNKAIQGLYPPGSTFKMVTVLAAIEAGVTTAGETFYCPGHKEVGGRRFHCHKRGGHGWMDMHNAIKRSCDVYFYELALKAGIENISAMAKRLGVGVRYDVPMSAVARGTAPTKSWKVQSKKGEWLIGDSLNAAIGQGYVLASPLHLAVMTARLATGQAIHPRLVKSVEGREQPIVSDGPLGISPTALTQVRKAMYAVNNDQGGTAYRSRIIAEGIRLAGKTGTSQSGSSIVNNETADWEDRDHALFVGFAPFDDPKYAVSVVVEHGGGGSTAAAPIARDILLQALYEGFPPLSAYPSGERNKAERMQKTLPLRGTGDGNASDRA